MGGLGIGKCEYRKGMGRMGSVLCCKEANSLEEGDGKRGEQLVNGK